MSLLFSTDDQIKYFQELKPFTCSDDIPDVPRFMPDVYNNIIVPNLIRCGAIPKDELIVDEWYEGSCRNSSKAKWTGEVFEYERYKIFETFTDSVKHFQDDDGYDIFIPIRHITKEEMEK